MVQAVTHYKNPKILAEISEDLGSPMVGINCEEIYEKWENRESHMDAKKIPSADLGYKTAQSADV